MTTEQLKRGLTLQHELEYLQGWLKLVQRSTGFAFGVASKSHVQTVGGSHGASTALGGGDSLGITFIGNSPANGAPEMEPCRIVFDTAKTMLIAQIQRMIELRQIEFDALATPNEQPLPGVNLGGMAGVPAADFGG